MRLENEYFIREEMLYMSCLYDRSGGLSTFVQKESGPMIVDKSNREIIEYTIRCLGFNLRGALETSKQVTGVTQMRPIMVNPMAGIVLFPTKSIEEHDVIWINPAHIIRTNHYQRKTQVVMSNEQHLVVDCTLASFTAKLANAEQLKRRVMDNVGKSGLYSMSADPKNDRSGPYCMILDPVKRKRKSRRHKNELDK